MFRRNKNSDDKGLPELADELGIPSKPGVRPPTAQPLPSRPTAPTPMSATPATPTALTPAAPTPAAASAPRPTEMPRRLGDTPAAPTPLSSVGGSAAQPAAKKDDIRRLIVGREISLTGEITSCDRLVVEGSVEANLANCRDIDIAESGLFKGSASIDEAEIRGRFEGNLTVRGRLLIRASGKVSGTIRYGQIEIECGGQISGDVQSETKASAQRPNVMAMSGE